MVQPRKTTTTILFTDLVNSTQVLQRAGDEAAQRIFQAHARMMREAIAANGGEEVKWTGDGLMVAFASTADAVRCAVAMQQTSRRPVAGERVQIRAGLHIGEALRHDQSDYFGSTVVIASRLCNAAVAGQILASSVVPMLLAGNDEFAFRDLGPLTLKGISSPVPACEIVYKRALQASKLTQTPFVGRVGEAAVLHKQLDEACGGRAGLSMLVGEPGIGKSRLAQEFSERANAEGVRVLWGRCYEGDWAPPFGPFLEAIKEYAGTVDREQLREDLGTAGSEIGRLVPAVRERLPELPALPTPLRDEDRYGLLDGVAAFFVAIARRAPLLLILDDLHWADGGTIAMLRHLVRSFAGARLLVLGSYRELELDRQHPLAAALAALRRDAGYERVLLRGLVASEVAELLEVYSEHDVPQALAQAINDETNGNPLFIRETLIHLLEEGKIVDEDGRWASNMTIAEMGIPEGVREVIGRRLSRLSEPCNAMLVRASGLTGGFSWAVLRAVSGSEDGLLVDALDEALRAQTLYAREGASTETYDFTHAMIRHTLYEELSAPRQVMLHHQIGEALERLYASDIDAHLAELAHHFYQAARGTDAEKAITYATRAGDRANTLFAYEEAAGHYQRALSCLELKEKPDRASECDLLLRLADAYSKEGDITRMRRTFLAAADAARELGAPKQLARAALGLGSGEDDFIGHDAALLALLEEAVVALEHLDGALQAMVLARLAEALVSSPMRDRAASLSLEAIEVARRLGDPATLVRALNAHHAAISSPDDLDARFAVSSEAAALAKGTSDRVAAWYAHDWQLQDLLEVGDIDGVDREIDVLVQLAQELRQPYWTGATAVPRSMRALLAGRFDEAERLIDETTAAGERLQALPLVFYSQIQLFALRREQGRLDEMEDFVQTWVASQENPGRAARLLTVYYAELGLVGEARREFEAVAADGFAILPRDNVWINTLCVLADVCTFLDDKPHARILYDLLLPYCARNVVGGDVVCLGSAARYLGMLAGTLARPEDAAAHFEAALEMNARLGATPLVAHVQYDYARMLLAGDDPEDKGEARSLLDASRDIAQRLGMAVLLRRASALGRAHGVDSGGGRGTT